MFEKSGWVRNDPDDQGKKELKKFGHQSTLSWRPELQHEPDVCWSGIAKRAGPELACKLQVYFQIYIPVIILIQFLLQ